MNTQENNKPIAEDLDNNKYEILWGNDKPFKSGDMAYSPMSGIVIEVYFDADDENADDEYYVQETYAQVKKLDSTYAEGGVVKVQEYGYTLFEKEVSSEEQAKEQINKLLNKYNPKRNKTSTYTIFLERNGNIIHWTKLEESGSTYAEGGEKQSIIKN